jgi:hypothetical protein
MAVGAVRPCPVAAAFFAGLVAGLGPHPSPKEERAIHDRCRLNLKPGAKPYKKSDSGGL